MEFENMEKTESLIEFIQGNREGYYVEYGRLWHRYLVYMILALFIMSVGELKVVCMFFQFMLYGYLLYELGKLSNQNVKADKCYKDNIMRIVPISFVGLYPFFWFFAVRNHSIVHIWISYRELAITAFAVFASIYLVFSQNNAETRKFEGRTKE